MLDNRKNHATLTTDDKFIRLILQIEVCRAIIKVYQDLRHVNDNFFMPRKDGIKNLLHLYFEFLPLPGQAKDRWCCRRGASTPVPVKGFFIARRVMQVEDCITRRIGGTNRQFRQSAAHERAPPIARNAEVLICRYVNQRPRVAGFFCVWTEKKQ